MLTLPTAMINLLLPFEMLFHPATWRKAQLMLIGAILALGKRTVTSVPRVMGLGHHENFALYCQRVYCSKVLEAQGDYLVIVKGNQPTLFEDIKLAFAEPIAGEEYKFTEDQGSSWRPQGNQAAAGYRRSQRVYGLAGGETDMRGRTGSRTQRESHPRCQVCVTSLGGHVEPQTLLKYIRGDQRQLELPVDDN